MLKFPGLVGISVTNQCNLNCIHCSNNSNDPLPDELTRQEIFSLIDEIADIGTMIIGYTGENLFADRISLISWNILGNGI